MNAGSSTVVLSEIDRDAEFESKCLATLSLLLFGPSCDDLQEADQQRLGSVLEHVSGLTEKERAQFVHLAAVHHVTVRTMSVLKRLAEAANCRSVAAWTASCLAAEDERISQAIKFLDVICHALERAGCPATVIKSLDHWPDLGGDLDLFTSGPKYVVTDTLTRKFGARLQTRSWGDRLAGKWNFQIPGLNELVEVHVKYLGQTGEHLSLAIRVEQRRVERRIGDYVFRVPAPEERIITAALQRMYRHFYVRLCDIANVAGLCRSNVVNFKDLRMTADLGGIWPGVATLLVLVAEYVGSYGHELKLPGEVMDAARLSLDRTFVRRQFLRIPIMPEAALLYGRQLRETAVKRDLRAVARLSLLPPLATVAFISERITKSDKGIW